MRKITLAVLLAISIMTVNAQGGSDQPAEKVGGFKKEMLFTGGNINLAFYSGGTILGASPQLGYSLNNWLDAGVLFGYTYSSQRDAFNNKYRQNIFTPGAFARVFPVSFLFASVQYEHNFIDQKILPANGSASSYSYKTDANSLLVGAGYTSGRMYRNSPYFYFSINVDIINAKNSPYTDAYNNLLPVFLAGFNIPLFQGSANNRHN